MNAQEPMRLPKLDELFCFPLYAASNMVTRAYGPLLSALGLTYPQYLVLLVLWESAPLTVRELGQRLMLESGTLSPLVARLERRKLVHKSTDASDGRRVVLTLTARGRDLAAETATVTQTLLCRLLENGGEESARAIGAMRDQLKQLIATWSESLSPTAAPEQRT